MSYVSILSKLEDNIMDKKEYERVNPEYCKRCGFRKLSRIQADKATRKKISFLTKKKIEKRVKDAS